MSFSKKEYQVSVKYFIVPICLFLLFRKGLTILLKKFVVNPIISTCYPGHWSYDLATIVISITVAIALVQKNKNSGEIPLRWIKLTLVYWLIYFYFRIAGGFDFTPLTVMPRLALLDVLGLIPTLAIIYCFTTYKRNPDRTQNSSMAFSLDKSITIDGNNDVLNRTKFVVEIATRIKNTETCDGSFAIGVVASWGAGKTTFINTLLSELKESGIILIEINVWRASNSSQIIETVFKALRDNLKSYSYILSSEIQDYVGNLLKGSQNDGLNSIKNLSEMVFSNQHVEQYETINNEIKRINKKILIAIDDLDRLDKREIYEVIRLIRNTANFAHTFFVVGYDRNYVLNAIEEINSFQAHQFLEEIFQLEFTLPPVRQSVLREQLSSKIEEILSTKDFEFFQKELSDGRGFIFEYDECNLTTSYICTIRDVVRYVNSFHLNYSFVRNEIFFRDFYNLELIRFKHPEVYSEVYRQRNRFFTTETEDKRSMLNQTYSLSKTKIGDTITSELSLFLKDQQSVYKLSNSDIDVIVRSYNGIFPEPQYLLSRKDKHNSHLSVIYPTMFDRYFFLGIEGSLSELEFGKMIALPISDLKMKLAELCTSQKYINEIAGRFERIEYFNSRDELEKVVIAIFHFANLPHPDRSENMIQPFIGYNGQALSKVLGHKSNSALYSNNPEEYKTFLKSIFRTDEASYTFTNDFVSSLLHSSYYHIDDIFSAQEISDILFENFRAALQKSDKLSWPLWLLFIRCENRLEKPISSGSYEVSYPLDKRALRGSRTFFGGLRNYACFGGSNID